ncbi:unnamed protein product [Darwinula stevensoni]|uniref:Uncharacterized protein n=1 Tax=Darwinula stevensoni TaxID=69355 RepID=A0A7R8XG26_9CRUS|nr:unnamed protein product [Darwinula stevensoni]CAG0891269.1 unnamed protein product [Darwinula stevensoni]
MEVGLDIRTYLQEEDFNVLINQAKEENQHPMGEDPELPQEYVAVATWPTWDEGAKRIGEEAVERGGILDSSTGAISSVTWEVLNENEDFPLLSSVTPFVDWGYE